MGNTHVRGFTISSFKTHWLTKDCFLSVQNWVFSFKYSRTILWLHPSNFTTNRYQMKCFFFTIYIEKINIGRLWVPSKYNISRKMAAVLPFCSAFNFFFYNMDMYLISSLVVIMPSYFTPSQKNRHLKWCSNPSYDTFHFFALIAFDYFMETHICFRHLLWTKQQVITLQLFKTRLLIHTITYYPKLHLFYTLLPCKSVAFM